MAVTPNPNQISARTLCIMALRDSGYLALGQSATAQILNETFIRLNWIIANWNAKRWLTWHLVDVPSPTTTGQQIYTIGPGGDFDPLKTFSADFNSDFQGQQGISGYTRPLKIEKAWARMNVNTGIPVDYPLELIPSYEDYSRITLKTMTNFPTNYFYDPSVPLGKLYFWPIPQANLFEMHVLVREPLMKFLSLDQPVFLPPEYEPALSLTLALWCRRAAKMPPDPELTMMAKDAVTTIKVNNTELATLKMPAPLQNRRGIYNVYSDESH